MIAAGVLTHSIYARLKRSIMAIRKDYKTFSIWAHAHARVPGVVSGHVHCR